MAKRQPQTLFSQQASRQTAHLWPVRPKAFANRRKLTLFCPLGDEEIARDSSYDVVIIAKIAAGSTGGLTSGYGVTSSGTEPFIGNPLTVMGAPTEVPEVVDIQATLESAVQQTIESQNAIATATRAAQVAAVTQTAVAFAAQATAAQGTVEAQLTVDAAAQATIVAAELMTAQAQSAAEATAVSQAATVAAETGRPGGGGNGNGSSISGHGSG